MRALARVERRDQRLDDADGSVIGARIAPGFEVMRFIHMPVAVLRSLVLIKPVMDAERDVGALQRVGETEISGRVVDRVPAHDHQQIHFARAHVGHKIAQGFGLIHGVGVDRVGVDDGLADVPECAFMRVRESMNRGRLVIAGDDDAGSLVPRKISGNCATTSGLSRASAVQHWRDSNRPAVARLLSG